MIVRWFAVQWSMAAVELCGFVAAGVCYVITEQGRPYVHVSGVSEWFPGDRSSLAQRVGGHGAAFGGGDDG